MSPRFLGTAALLCAAAFAAASAPATAEVRLFGDSGNYTVRGVMSWWEIPYRSVVRQQYDFSCGSAAVATLLTFHYDEPTPERVAFAYMWQNGDQAAIRKVGFSLLDMKNYLTERGLRAEGYRLGKEGLLKLKRPAIALLDLKGFKHFVVIKGVRGDRVLVGDPMLGLNEYALDDFMTAWNGIGLAVVNGREAPKFNLASDWGPWAKSPMQNAAIYNAPDDILVHLPPSYQLTPQILIDVNVGTVP